jgi:diguanylate cyclase (GGDEF)-like protein
MRLRTRLWLVLGALFLVPLAVGALVLAVVVPDARSERASGDVRRAAATVSAQLADQCALLGVAARLVPFEAAASDPGTAVRQVVSGGIADYAALLTAEGTVVAEAGRLPEGSAPPDELPGCAGGRAGTDPLAERATVEGAPGASTAVVSVDLTAAMMRDLRARSGVDGDVLLLDGQRVVASSSGASTAADAAADAARQPAQVVEADGWTVAAQGPRQGVPYTVVVAVPETNDATRTLLVALILIAGAAAAGLLVTVVARGLAQPFADLTEAAERVVEGDLDAAVAASDEGEAGRLGTAFNRVTSELRRSLRELERSRQDLRDSLERIGDTLTSTHDLDGLLQVVLETASATLGARAGVVLHRSADQLQVVAEQGLRDAGLRLPAAVTPGSGVLGKVISSGVAARGRLGSGPAALQPAETEPGTGDVLAVPLRSMGAIVGVVALYDRLDGRPFDAADEDALGTLAGQASIAIDNVQLHHEAQRLSTTDALTGLWNFRYLSMSLAREIERSTRFDRPLAVLMLDLDHFKRINDLYGHARGDAVLRELAHRVHEQIREVDTFARYGGEEFVVVLPETTVEGAAQLAERICVAVRREPFHLEGEESLDVTVSIGGAAFPDHGSTPATLMRAADKALYVAKGEGRDRWHVPGAQAVAR